MSIPSESQRVQQRAQDHLEPQFELLRELFDTVAAKDWANCTARADVKVGGRLLLADVPVTYLLFLEKQFEDLKTTIAALPVLGQDHNWTLDPVQGLQDRGSGHHQDQGGQAAHPAGRGHQGASRTGRR
ncbi:MAG: hypothetical protein AB1758_05895 [Candidatus Eremiobacterota bacterium]